MYPRILVISSVVNPTVFNTLLPPLGVMAVGTYLAAGAAWWRARDVEPSEPPAIRNPFSLMEAIRFGLLLVAILILSRLLVDNFGDRGIYYLASVSGLADVDAITLSLSRMSLQDLPIAAAAIGIILAATVNCVTKSGIAFVVGNIGLGWRVGTGLMGPAALGVAVYFALRVS
jgi:uncharacterized membrane protein (DUF4010 family)